MADLVVWPSEKKLLSWTKLRPGEFFAFCDMKSYVLLRVETGYLYCFKGPEKLSGAIWSDSTEREVVPLDLTKQPQFTVRQ